MRSDARIVAVVPAARRAAAVMTFAALAAGCEIPIVNVPIQQSTVVVHAVLSGTATTQTILVERTLTGEVTIMPFVPIDGGAPVGSFNSAEQVLSDGGNPERGAVVEVVTPSGQAVAAPEYTTFTSRGNGAGMYRASIPGSSLVAGGKYQLRIRTARGEVITAETVVPGVPAVGTPAPAEFNRSTEQLALTWAQNGSARAYEIRIDNPFNAWISLSDSTHVSLSGSLRNVDADNLGRVFIPGFRQNVTVSAVDSNLYDYYRTVNSGFTGSGIVNRVKGGIGVFGSYVTVHRRTLDVTASTSRPIEGMFDLVPGGPNNLYGGAADARVITLYVESPSAKAGQPDALTAQVRHGFGTFVSAAVGTQNGDSVRIHFLNGQQMNDTLDTFKATLRGDTLDGKFSKGAPAKYARRTP